MRIWDDIMGGGKGRENEMDIQDGDNKQVKMKELEQKIR